MCVCVSLRLLALGDVVLEDKVKLYITKDMEMYLLNTTSAAISLRAGELIGFGTGSFVEASPGVLTVTAISGIVISGIVNKYTFLGQSQNLALIFGRNSQEQQGQVVAMADRGRHHYDGDCGHRAAARQEEPHLLELDCV